MRSARSSEPAAPGKSPFLRCVCACVTNELLAGLSVAGAIFGRSRGTGGGWVMTPGRRRAVRAAHVGHGRE